MTNKQKGIAIAAAGIWTLFIADVAFSHADSAWVRALILIPTGVIFYSAMIIGVQIGNEED